MAPPARVPSAEAGAYDNRGTELYAQYQERLRSLIGRGERTIKLAEKMPIHLAYFTLTTDASGNLQRHPDIYGHSQRLKQLVGLP